MNLVKSLSVSYVAISISLILAFLLWSNHLFAGTPPTNLGLTNGKFAPCATTPNCVNSQAPASDAIHYIEPIAFGGEVSARMEDLQLVVKNMPQTKIIKATNDYLYVEFTSKVMGFVDDVEFGIQDGGSKTIQVRSASRLGESDLGVNRHRIEEIRSNLAKLN